MHTTTGAVCAQSVRTYICLSSDLNCRARHHSVCMSPRRPSIQRTEQRAHMSCPPPYLLAYPTPTLRTEARAAPLPVFPNTTVACRSHGGRKTEANQTPSTFLPATTVTCCANAERAHGARAAPSSVAPATTVAARAHANR
jgi:hypothetical protein